MKLTGSIRVVGAMLAGLLAGPGAFALNPGLDVSQYAHKSWTAGEGYFKGSISAIAQTPDGYLWLGTDFGLVRFDGVRFVPWTPPDGQQLPSNAGLRLMVTPDGSLWISTQKGLARWKGDRLHQYTELAGRIVGKVLEDRSGTVWAAVFGVTAGQLCTIQDSGVRCYGDDGRFGSWVLSLYEYQGGLWAGALTGLWRWKPDPPQFYAMPSPKPEISDLIGSDDGAVWMATRDGIRQWIHGKVDPAPLPAASGIVVVRMLRDRDGGLWIGTMGQGLVHLHQGKTDRFTSADGLSGSTVSDLFEDREGNIWAATEEGIDRFRDLAVPEISLRQGLGENSGAVVAARDGSIWIGTNDGLQRWNNGRMTVYRRSDRRTARRAPSLEPPVGEINNSGLPDNVIQSLFEDGRGRIWVSTPSGVAYLQNGRFVPVAPVSANMVHGITEASSGNVWINEQRLGLLHLVDGRLEEQVSLASLGRQDIATALAVDPARGGLWLGLFQSGLAYFKDDRIRLSYARPEGLGGGWVNDIRIDHEGTLWAATEGGLSRLKNGRISTLTSRNGLPCDAVHWTAEDDAGSIWLNLTCGLARVARAEMEAAMDRPLPAQRAPRRGSESGSGSETGIIHATVFDRSDGVRSYPGLGYSPQFAKAADGKLWFTMNGGVGVVDPRHLPFNRLSPPVQIEQVIADRKTYARGAKLPALVRDVEIDYTALSFAAPEKNQFKYKLEGYDRDWQDAGNRRQAFYTNLPPRNYRFRVMAANNDGVWNEAGASSNFSVAPAYYQTTWFGALVAAAVLAALTGLHRLRLLYVTNQFNARLEGRVSERIRVARDLHDTLLQSFQGTLLKFHSLSYLLTDHPQASKTLENCIEQARAAITEGRDAVQGLRSSTVVANDLARAIGTFGQALAADHAGPDCPEFVVQVEGRSRDLPPLVRDEVYRIACECLRNGFEHARANRIEVRIRYDQRRFWLQIADNGKGIDAAVLSVGGRAGHHGLAGIRERAELAGGKLSVWSQRGSGTEIELSIPGAVAYAKTSSAKTAGVTQSG